MGATVTDPLVGRLVDGRYEVVSRIARGGMATVYLAIDRRLDREVALKVMHPHLAESTSSTDFVSRFRREARAAARLTHPGLVAVYDQGVDEETSYLTMELVDGTNLRRRITTAGALSVQEAFDTAEAILDALAAAHRNNLVHRDIKPENVLISSEGRIKLADFGLARAVTEVTSTTTGTILGTVAYLAPELILTGECDARTDVYSVGILLYEMLVGAQPYTGGTPIQVAYRHVNEDVPAPSRAEPQLPAEIDALVCALAARDPDDRPRDATAALDLLRRVKASLTSEDLALRSQVVPADPTTEPEPASDTDPEDEPATEEVAGADPADPGSEPDQDVSPGPREEATEALLREPAGSTIALPLGVGAEDPDGTEIRRRRRKKHIAVTLVTVLTLALAVIAYGAWWLNVGPGAYTNVPTGLVGSSAEAASSALEQFGLHPEITEQHDDSVAQGDVIATQPDEGQRIPKEGTVELVVSLGILMRTMPEDIVGADVVDATRAITEAQLQVGAPTYEYDDDAESGIVLAVSEDEGGSIPYDRVITLTVSRGPQPVTVPQVVNSTQDEAVEALESEGLKVTVEEAYSDNVAEGRVVEQSPAAAAAAHRTDTVTIVISKGREPVEVPDVQGMSTEEAHATLEALDLVVVDQLAWGGFLQQVRFQSIDPGTSVPKGTTITLTIF